MHVLALLVSIIAASAVHAAALRIAVRLMVDVGVGYRQAYVIVALEYLAIILVATALVTLESSRPVTLVASSLTYLAVGAVLIGRRLSFAAGSPLGIGNGVLIQAIQIPLLLPLFIVGSFTFGGA